MKLYYVYILASFHRVLYIGITGNLEKRLAYHRSLANPNAFTARYAMTRLVYVEEFTDVNQRLRERSNSSAGEERKRYGSSSVSIHIG